MTARFASPPFRELPDFQQPAKSISPAYLLHLSAVSMTINLSPPLTSSSDRRTNFPAESFSPTMPHLTRSETLRVFPLPNYFRHRIASSRLVGPIHCPPTWL